MENRMKLLQLKIFKDKSCNEDLEEFAALFLLHQNSSHQLMDGKMSVRKQMSSYNQKRGFLMTEYMYIASTIPLNLETVTKKRNDHQSNEFLLAFKEMFQFEENVSEDTGGRFSYSVHFPFKELPYQAAALAGDMPSFDKRDNQAYKYKSCLRGLEAYIQEQFKEGCHQLAVLYSLNSYENESLKSKETIYLSDLKYQDLYYSDNRLILITI